MGVQRFFIRNQIGGIQMKKSKKVVIGKYQNPEDVKAALQRLERDGYTREDVTLYTNNSNLEKFEKMYDIDMLADETKTVSDTDGTNDSFWNKVKHMVSYDNDEETNLSDGEAELVEPYKEDIDAGYTVITVRERDKTKNTANDEGVALYDSEVEMNGTEVVDADVSETSYDNDDFHDIYEIDKIQRDKESPYFDDPDGFKSDVTGKDYLDSGDINKS